MKPREVLFGIHPVWEALRAGRRQFFSIHLPEGTLSGRLSQIRNAAAEAGIPVTIAADARLRSLAQNDKHQGVVAEVSPFPLSAPNILEAPTDRPSFFLAADGVTDPRNLGALIRSALSVGVQAILLPQDRSAPPSPVVSSSSAGALEHIQVVSVVNLVRSLIQLKDQGVWIYGLDHAGKQTCFETDFTGPTLLVVGGEGKGIRPLVKKTCDLLISIPQEGAVSSLNASVAGAVVMYEAFRQRSARRGEAPKSGR